MQSKPAWPKSSALGHYPFHYVVRAAEVHDAQDALVRSYDYFTDTFNDAHDFLRPTQWRLLRYAMPIRWALLADQSFDPRSEIIQLAASAAESGIPAELLGGFDPKDVAIQIRSDLSDADVDMTKAIWTLVSFIQFIKLPPPATLQLEWWTRPVWHELLLPR